MIKGRTTEKSTDRTIQVAALSLLSGILFYPYLITGFYLDDSHNSVIRSLFQVKGLSLGNEIWNNALHWLTYDGRLYPFASLMTAVYYYAPNPFIYHGIICIFSILSLITFYAWLRSHSIDRALSTLLTGIVLCLFQIRDYHDPLTSYAGLLQISAILGFGSSLLFNKYLTRGSLWRLLLSCFLLLSAFLFYEVNLVFFCLLIATALQMRQWKPLIIPTAITTAYLGTTLYLRVTHPSHYPGTMLALNFGHLGNSGIFRAFKTYLVFPTRTICALGIHTLVLTNAAGAVNTRFRPGDLMFIEDHLNLMGDNPLKGPNLAQLGPRFPDLSEAYNKECLNTLQSVAHDLEIPVHTGIYAGLLGPTYETPAEVRMLRTLGADAVGMSTVPESIAANHLGVRVAGLSCITNLAAGLSPHKLSHDEVIENSKLGGDKMQRILTSAIPLLARHSQTPSETNGTSSKEN